MTSTICQTRALWRCLAFPGDPNQWFRSPSKVAEAVSGQRGLLSRGTSHSDLSTVTRLTTDDMRQAQQHLEEQQKPFVLVGAMNDWSLLSWSPNELAQRYGDVQVPVEVSVAGSDYRDLHAPEGHCGRSFIPEQLTSLSELINHMKQPALRHQRSDAGVRLYFAQRDLFQLIPDLEKTVKLPPFPMLHSRIYQRNAWLGPAGTKTPLHRDPYHNIFCQVWGSKHITLFPPSSSARVYPFSTPFLRNASQVNVEAADHDRFPEFADAPRLYCKLAAAEMLYIPKRWWHFVQAAESSLSVTYWWT